MNVNNPISLRQLDQATQKFATFGSMEKNERLFTMGNRFYKNRAPDRVLRGKENPVLRAIHKIITLVLKIIQAIGRVLTGQKVEKNIQKATDFSTELEELLKQDLPQANSRDHYEALQKLNKLHASLETAHKVGLPEYLKTCKEGNASLQKDSEEVLQNRAEAVKSLIGTVSGISSTLKAKIDEAEKRTLECDLKVVKELLGKLVENEDVTPTELEEKYFLLAAVRKVITEKYGETVASRVLEYYKLSDNAISGRDLSALLVGIVVNLTYKDLKVIYEKGSDGNAFEMLGDEQLCRELQKVRDINGNLFRADSSMKYQKQFAQDLELLERFRTVDEYGEDIPVKDLKKLSYTEYLARLIAYGLFHQGSAKFPDGILIPVYDKKGNLQLKEAYILVSEKGIHGAIIKPVIIDSEQEKAKAQVIFRGTHCRDSLLRDIGPFFVGPGKRSFKEKRDHITEETFKHIEQMVEKSEEGELKVCVEFIGHSLGGTDAQRALEYFAYQLKTKENHRVAGVNLYAFNSPNVESDVAEGLIDSVDQLKIPVRLRYFDVHNDPIQEFGTKRLGFCLKGKPDNLKRSIFKFNRSKRSSSRFWKALEAHSFYCLKLHDNEDEKVLNTIYVDHLFTDFEGNDKYRYGENRKKESENLDLELLNDRFVTRVCHIGRNIKKLVGGGVSRKSS
ncbi:MAG: hypothetical protein K940chlam7_01254 [Chlamydiae bacterium]|nr:hypothetical protein [Chlamydiota bacterium]